MPPPPVSLKDPSTLVFQSNVTKRSIIASYWIVILLSVPLWWYTTSIQRLSLPETQIYAHARQRLHIPIDVCVEDGSAAFALRDILSARSLENPGRWTGVKLQFYGQEECRQSCQC
jgi:phosphatidylinositol glycan class S